MSAIVRPAPDLVEIQRLSQQWAPSRQTPYGIPIPRFAVPVTKFGFVQVPAAYGTEVVLVTYQAKANWFCLLCGLVAGYSGTGTAPLAGDVKFTVDVDRPLGAATGYQEKDYGRLPFPVGDFQRGPVWPVEFRLMNSQTIRLKATPVQTMSLGPGNNFVGALVGFEWPSKGDEW
jgi:hypothetical protein